MAIDPTNLTQTELLQIVNSGALGTVLTRSRLRRQMDAAALRFGDGIQERREMTHLQVESGQGREKKGSECYAEPTGRT